MSGTAAIANADAVPRLAIRAARSEPGDGLVNEDVVGAGAGAAWVIDGATGLGEPLLPGVSDAAWFARSLDTALRDALACSPGDSTTTLLRRAVETVATAYARLRTRVPAAAYELPSAAFAMVRATPDGVELSAIGDCRIIYRDESDDIRLFAATGVERFEKITLGAVAALLRDGPQLRLADVKARILPQLRENRARMNTVDGYWILGLHPAAVDHVEHRVVPLATDGFECLLASDGFMRLHELFGLFTPANMLAASDEGKIDTLMAALRRTEDDDPDGRRFTRTKCRDDASCAFVRIER